MSILTTSLTTPLTTTDNDTPSSQHGHNQLNHALIDVHERFCAANPKSMELWQQSKQSMPGGNTRTVLHYDPFPLTMVKGEGAYLYDCDGHKYIDFLGEYSAGLYGHSHPLLIQSIKDAIDQGMVLGAPNQWEAKLSSVLCERFPSMDLVRFTNSGTEANLMALGAARAFTKREKIMVFEGGYHGGVLYFAHGTSPLNAPFDVVMGAYNEIEKTIALIEKNASDLAVVLLEPMLGAGGCLPAEPDFLRALRDVTTKHGIILIFDEVMTSRMSSGGLQKRLGITPDMTTLGKYIGGGASFGAFGGRADIMEQFNPSSPGALAHAGTFNNNVISMAAGYTGMSQIFTPDVAEEHFNRGNAFRDRLNTLIKARDLSLQFTGTGSILGFQTHSNPIKIPSDAVDHAPDKQSLIHLEMMMRGIVYATRGFFTLSLALSDNDQEEFIKCFEDVISCHAELLV